MDIVPPFASDTTPFAALARHAKETPDKLAVVTSTQAVSYRDLARRVAAVGGALARRGIGPGDRVAVDVTDTADHLVGMLAATAIGAIAVALPADRASASAIRADAEPALVITTGPESREAGDGTQAGFAALLTEGEGAEGASLGRLVSPDEIAMIYYTSGTSGGVRKGVMQSHRQLHHTVHYIAFVMRLDETVREFVASPTDNAFWFGRCRCLLHVGGTALLNSGTLNPLSIVSALNRHDGNALSGDTAVFMLLLHHMEKHIVRLAPQMRWIKIASAPMPLADKQRMMALLPNARIVFNYGLTEAMRTCLNVFNDNPDRIDTVGRPSPTVELAVMDEGTIAPSGHKGEVMIRGGNLASGYWRKDAMWAAKMRDGWYRSGDLGWLDDEGFLHLSGRLDEAINSGGKTISLAEVDRLMRPCLLGTRFAVLGISDPKGVLGEVVALAVEGQWIETESWNEKRIGLFEAMEPLMVPSAAFLVPELPRTANGKVRLNVLREQVEAGEHPAL